MSGIEKFRAIVKATVGKLVMLAVIAGMGYLIMQFFSQGEMLREITPDPGMTKHCTQNSEGQLACSQVPAVSPAPPAAAPDPNAPLYVTVTVAE